MAKRSKGYNKQQTNKHSKKPSRPSIATMAPPPYQPLKPLPTAADLLNSESIHYSCYDEHGEGDWEKWYEDLYGPPDEFPRINQGVSASIVQGSSKSGARIRLPRN